MRTVRELLSHESRWCRKALARKKTGTPCLPHDEEAVKWCLMGALEKCYGGSLGFQLYKKVGVYLKTDPSEWNDNAKFSEVRKLAEDLRL